MTVHPELAFFARELVGDLETFLKPVKNCFKRMTASRKTVDKGRKMGLGMLSTEERSIIETE